MNMVPGRLSLLCSWSPGHGLSRVAFRGHVQTPLVRLKQRLCGTWPMVVMNPRVGIRQFSSSARVCGFISNIGKQPIPIPPNVTITQSTTSLAVKGPLGEIKVPLESYMQLSSPHPNVLSLTVENGAIKNQRAMWGTTRSLINNAIVGMTQGFFKPLYLVGVGYRAALEEDPRGTVAGGNGKRLNLKLGHSHNIYVPIPANITAEVPSATKIVLSSTNNVALGHFAAKIRRFRPPEPYKGKGVFIGDETIRLKAIKKK